MAAFSGELNPNASRPDALGPFWRHPYHSAFYVKRRGFIQQREQQLYLVSQFMPLCGRNEQPAITKEGHVGVVQRRQVFDHDLENVSHGPLVMSFPQTVWFTPPRLARNRPQVLSKLSWPQFGTAGIPLQQEYPEPAWHLA